VNRPPTPDDTAEEEEKQPTLHETINIKVLFLFFSEWGFVFYLFLMMMAWV
jgi:uncharacterized membrane protein